jgi:hypothetical protein
MSRWKRSCKEREVLKAKRRGTWFWAWFGRVHQAYQGVLEGLFWQGLQRFSMDWFKWFLSCITLYTSSGVVTGYSTWNVLFLSSGCARTPCIQSPQVSPIHLLPNVREQVIACAPKSSCRFVLCSISSASVCSGGGGRRCAAPAPKVIVLCYVRCAPSRRCGLGV